MKGTFPTQFCVFFPFSTSDFLPGITIFFFLDFRKKIAFSRNFGFFQKFPKFSKCAIAIQVFLLRSYGRWATAVSCKTRGARLPASPASKLPTQSSRQRDFQPHIPKKHPRANAMPIAPTRFPILKTKKHDPQTAPGH